MATGRECSTSVPQEKSMSNAAPRTNLGRKPHVVVIGAGVAGLRCTDILLERGIRVTLIEGRDRVGGRVYQIEQRGYLLDMGANWIHGTIDNPILDLADETDTVYCSIGEECSVFNEYGCGPLSQRKTSELQDIVWGIISDAFKYSKENFADIDPKKSLWHFMHEELEKRDLSSDDLRIAGYMAEQWGHFSGDHYSLQSLKYFWMEENLPGENLFVANSYKAVVDRVAAKAKAEATVLLGHQVTTVGYVLGSDPPQTKVYSTDLIKRESQVTQCDAVVLTVPLGVLKRGLPAIHPKPLPSPIQAGIDGLGFGQLEKLYISFAQAWWNEDDTGPSFFQFLHPIFDDGNDTSGIVDIMDLSLLPGDTAQPTLLFYLHGAFAYDLIQELERYEDDERAAEQYVARRFVHYFSSLPNYSTRNPLCEPTAVAMTRWRSDPFTFGSYTNFPISGMQGMPHLDLVKGVEALRHGIPERGLYFAGEHTAPFVAIGTVTGAYWSGEHVAKRIADSFVEQDTGPLEKPANEVEPNTQESAPTDERKTNSSV